MRKTFAALALMAGTMAMTSADAHHSFGMFDMTKEVTIEGKVRKFQWTNPHSYIQIVAKDAAGKDVEYSMEMGAPMYLYARGWRPSTLKPGMDISITMHPLRNGKPGGVVMDVTTPDGKPIGTNK